MKCDDCRWYEPFNGVCCNADSERCADMPWQYGIEKCEKGKNKMKIVNTGDILTRCGKNYEVIIADRNIFVVCENKYDEGEKSYVTNYENAEIYANQSEINSLSDLNFENVFGNIK